MVPTLTMLWRLSECTRAVIAVPEVPTALVTSASMTLCSCRPPLGAAIGERNSFRCARLRRACDRLGPSHGAPRRPAAPPLRSAGAIPWRPAAPGCAALAIGWGPPMATRCARLRRACDRLGPSHGDPLRPAAPRLRSAGAVPWRPAAPGCAAPAIGWGRPPAAPPPRLRRACDRLGPSHGDPLRPAAPRLRSPWDHLRCGGVSFRGIPAAPERGTVVAADPHDVDRGAELATRTGRLVHGADHDRIRDVGTDRRLRRGAEDEGPDGCRGDRARRREA